MTHSDLITQATTWLKKQQCTVIITDMSSCAQETPDAIGFGTKGSTLVEVKVSRSDFLTDRHKPWRRSPDQGMGKYRYYLTLPGIIKLEDLPAHWGLLEITASKIRCLQKATPQPARAISETRLLVSAIRRIGSTSPVGISCQCYTFTSKNRATISINTDP